MISSSSQSVDKQAMLSNAVAIASDAAAIALLSNKDASRAIELLEIGRNVIASSLQDLRIGLFMLQEKHPDLFNQCSQLRHQLDEADVQDDATKRESATSETGFLGSDGRRQVNEQLQNLLDEIRIQPGFEDFLLARSAADMQAAAKDGPIVIINLSGYRCDALIVELSGFRTVPLPNISWDTIQDHDVYSLETLEWLWDDVVKPVLDALELTQQPPDDHWPHICWIPTGRLVGYPLHAAGYHMRQSGETALDRVVSSYSSSVKTIIHSHRQRDYKPQEIGCDHRLALVPMEITPGYRHLKYAREEAQTIRDLVDSSTTLSLVEPLPLKNDVLSALTSCSIFHFAGHGGTDPTSPLKSHLLLSDWRKDPLTVDNVFETNLSREVPFLAYLSACGTSEIKAVSLVDESIHLAAAFQLAGFQHVVGTLWSVDDQMCVNMARMIYEGLLEGGMRDEAVGPSLHKATREIRDQWVDGKIGHAPNNGRGWLRHVFKVNDTSDARPDWVPYVHYGV
ncbi:hypothetical protein ACHAPU_006278 [Fusarium lateritium]